MERNDGTFETRGKRLIMRLITQRDNNKVNQVIIIANTDLLPTFAIVRGPNQMISIANEIWSCDYYKVRTTPNTPSKAEGQKQNRNRLD